MPLLPLLQQTVSPRVTCYTEALIKRSATPAAVYRLTLEYAASNIGLDTLILKRIQPKFPDDPGFPNREMYFYACVLPQLDISHAHIYFAGIDPETQDRLILMEDLTTYHLPPPTHPWTQAEGECMARAYARLHMVSNNFIQAFTFDPHPSTAFWEHSSTSQSLRSSEGELRLECFQNSAQDADKLYKDWLLPRHETRLETENVGEMACELIRQKIWEPIPGLEGLITRTLDAARTFTHLPTTLLHNDVYPPNVALPPNLNDDAILLDWEMASYGLPEMDLAFMFIQPYRAHQFLDKARVLDAYWAVRHVREGCVPSREEREIRQYYADAVWGLWLVPVAYKMAAHPYPAGSAVAEYWQSMVGVLEEHLRRLSRRVLL